MTNSCFFYCLRQRLSAGFASGGACQRDAFGYLAEIASGGQRTFLKKGFSGLSKNFYPRGLTIV
jgi:hypothetical protein